MSLSVAMSVVTAMPDQEPAVLLAGDHHHLTAGDIGHGGRVFVGLAQQ